MFNLIKMDIYRLIHSTSTWVTMLFVVLLSVFCVFMTNTDIQLMEDDPQSVITEESDERTIGIMVEADPEWATGKIEIGSIISVEVRSGMLALLCIIFAALFSNAEQKNGFIKNIAGQFPGRGKLIISKIVALAVQVFMMLLVFSLVAAATGFVLWGNRFYMGSIVALLQFLGVQYLLHLGFASVIMFLCILTRSTAFGMTTGILACSGILVPIYSGINKLVYDIKPGWNFNINNYVLDGNITLIRLNAVSDVMLRGVLVGIAFTVVFTILAMAVMKKRDIR